MVMDSRIRKKENRQTSKSEVFSLKITNGAQTVKRESFTVAVLSYNLVLSYKIKKQALEGVPIVAQW